MMKPTKEPRMHYFNNPHELDMPQAETLIQNALRTALDRVGGRKANKFLALSLERVQEFIRLYDAATPENLTEETFTRLFKNAPAALSEEEYEDYALFVHHLLKEGDLYGMVHEDPLSALVLIGSAVTLFKKLVVEKGKTHLIPHALDLLLSESVAQASAGGHDAAKLYLTTLLNMTYDDTILQNEFMVSDSVQLQATIRPRAAVSAMMLASLLDDENEEEKTKAARTLAKDMFQTILDEERTQTDRLELLTAAIAMAEIHMHEENRRECIRMLDLAIDYAKHDLKAGYSSIPYYFVASLAYKKRGAMCVNGKKKHNKRALVYFEKAKRLANKCVVAYPNNTHYLDHYGEILNDMGVVQGVDGNIIAARDAFLETLDSRQKLQKCSKRYTLALLAAINNLVVLMRRIGNTDVAKVYVQDALNLIESVVDGDDVDGVDNIRLIFKAMLADMEESEQTAPLERWSPMNDSKKFGSN